MKNYVEDLIFVVSPETYALKGEVTIAHVDDDIQKRFVLNSTRSLSEWDGRGAATISSEVSSIAAKTAMTG